MQELTLTNTLISLKDLPTQPIRLGLQGPPGSGKTWAALTFPNPIIWNLDNKLVGYKNKYPDSNIQVVNPTKKLIVDQLKVSNMGFNKPNNPNAEINIRDGFKKWIDLFGPQLTNNMTLVIDSWTSLQNWFGIQTQKPHEKSITKQGEEDRFYFWKFKLNYSVEITEQLKTLQCNVVVICHETIERDEEGRATGKLRPLMSGQFADQLAGQMTDFYRQIPMPKLDHRTGKPNLIENGEPIKEDIEYVWQTQSDNMFIACRSIDNLPKFIRANYSSLSTRMKDKTINI